MIASVREGVIESVREGVIESVRDGVIETVGRRNDLPDGQIGGWIMTVALTVSQSVPSVK